MKHLKTTHSIIIAKANRCWKEFVTLNYHLFKDSEHVHIESKKIIGARFTRNQRALLLDTFMEIGTHVLRMVGM